jgi:hypothetical protein
MFLAEDPRDDGEHSEQPAGQAAGNRQRAGQGKPTAPAKPLGPLQIVLVTPADGGKDADGAAPVKITFNEAVAASTPMPAASTPMPAVVPKISGTWSACWPSPAR